MKHLLWVLIFVVSPSFADVQFAQDGFLAAVLVGDTAKVAELIKQGADVDVELLSHIPLYWTAAKNTDDWREGSEPALVVSVRKGRLAMVKLLVEAGANMQSGELMTAAAFAGNIPVVEYLISKGASLEGSPDPGFNALHGAVLGGSLEMVKYLVEKQRMDVNKSTAYGETALMYAANNSLPMVKYLLQNGARINDVSEPEVTALDWARGNKEIYKYLKKHGAKSGQE